MSRVISGRWGNRTLKRPLFMWSRTEIPQFEIKWKQIRPLLSTYEYFWLHHYIPPRWKKALEGVNENSLHQFRGVIWSSSRIGLSPFSQVFFFYNNNDTVMIIQVVNTIQYFILFLVQLPIDIMLHHTTLGELWIHYTHTRTQSSQGMKVLQEY